MATHPTPPRRWEAELRILPSGRVALQLCDQEHSSLTVCHSPSMAIRTLEQFLGSFRSWYDEFVIWSRTEAGPPQMWTTRSPAGGLYWCTIVLGKIWPPPWVPLVERRGSHRYAGVPPFEPPLIERRNRARKPRAPKPVAN